MQGNWYNTYMKFKTCARKEINHPETRTSTAIETSSKDDEWKRTRKEDLCSKSTAQLDWSRSKIELKMIGQKWLLHALRKEGLSLLSYTCLMIMSEGKKEGKWQSKRHFTSTIIKNRTWWSWIDASNISSLPTKTKCHISNLFPQRNRQNNNNDNNRETPAEKESCTEKKKKKQYSSATTKHSPSSSNG